MCIDIVQQGYVDHNVYAFERRSIAQDVLNTRVEGLAKDNFSSNKRTFIANKWSAGSPFSQEQINDTRNASVLEKEEAKEHIKNSWAALGNNLPGDVIKESYLAWECLRNSEKLDRQACNMENMNIDYENSGR